MIDLWFNEALIYCLDVDSFQDSDGDGVGDFPGLTDRLDYLAGLGVTCVWLLPFYPSPDRDNGYDVCDYYGVDHRLGTLGDFVEFLHKAREHGIRVIVDLVVNHTSDQHPWFQAARKSPDSPYRDYYVWSQDPPDDPDIKPVFPGEQDSVWTYDEAAGEYYFHHFYEHQPDLNMSNPRVRDEICRVMGFWIALGVSGFRLDAATFLINEEGACHALREFRDFLSWRQGDAILLAEANVTPDKMPKYFEDGIHMMFNFWVNQHLMLAFAREDATPLREAFEEVSPHPACCQFANFLRNHDELDLSKLTEAERQEIYAQFAPDENMRIFDRGIRRRIPSMFEGDRARLELAYSLLYSLPGVPVLRYGEEIGMGEDLSQPGRESVRTSMQWTDDPNAGFSTAPADELARPVISEGPFAYPKVDVAHQHLDDDSFLNWIERIIRIRKSCPEIGNGEFKIIDTPTPALFAHRCDWKNSTVLLVHNFSSEPQSWDYKCDNDSTLLELVGEQSYKVLKPGQPLKLGPYGYRWFRLTGPHLPPA